MSNHPIERTPGGWTRTFTLTCLSTVVLGLAGFEWYWRSQNYRPMPSDSADRWSMKLERGLESPDSTLLIGSSQIQLGIDPVLLSEQLGRHVFQLGINGGATLPVVEYLAEETDFKGLAVVEFMPILFVETDPLSVQKAQSWLDAHRNATVVRAVETRLRYPFQMTFSFMHPDATFKNLLRTLVGEGTVLDPRVISFREDRYIEGRYGYWRTAGTGHRGKRSEHSSRISESLADAVGEGIERVAEWARTIEGRGGHLVVVRLPSCGATRRREGVRFPRELVYDRFADGVPGCWIHFEDNPATASLKCGDGVHLGVDEASVFTRELGSMLASGSVCRPPRFQRGREPSATLGPATQFGPELLQERAQGAALVVRRAIPFR